MVQSVSIGSLSGESEVSESAKRGISVQVDCFEVLVPLEMIMRARDVDNEQENSAAPILVSHLMDCVNVVYTFTHKPITHLVIHTPDDALIKLKNEMELSSGEFAKLIDFQTGEIKEGYRLMSSEGIQCKFAMGDSHWDVTCQPWTSMMSLLSTIRKKAKMSKISSLNLVIGGKFRHHSIPVQKVNMTVLEFLQHSLSIGACSLGVGQILQEGLPWWIAATSPGMKSDEAPLWIPVFVCDTEWVLLFADKLDSAIEFAEKCFEVVESKNSRRGENDQIPIGEELEFVLCFANNVEITLDETTLMEELMFDGVVNEDTGELVRGCSIDAFEIKGVMF